MSKLYPRPGDIAVVRLRIVRVGDERIVGLSDRGEEVTLTDDDHYAIEPKLEVGEKIYDSDGLSGEVLKVRGHTAVILWDNGTVMASVPIADVEREREFEEV
jgi:hypothetical protein